MAGRRNSGRKDGNGGRRVGTVSEVGEERGWAGGG